MAYRQTERTRARAADARERILAAAHARLAAGGYAATAVADVARHAGVATGTVYRHFPSKAELVAAAFRRAAGPEVEAVRAAAAPAPGREPADRIAAGVETFVLRALAQPRRAYALLAEPVDPAVEALRLEYRRAYADVFARVLRDAGTQRPALTAAALVGALGEALLGPLAGAPSGEDPDELVAALQAFAVSAAIPRSPRVHA